MKLGTVTHVWLLYYIIVESRYLLNAICCAKALNIVFYDFWVIVLSHHIHDNKILFKSKERRGWERRAICTSYSCIKVVTLLLMVHNIMFATLAFIALFFHIMLSHVIVHQILYQLFYMSYIIIYYVYYVSYVILLLMGSFRLRVKK